MTLANDHKNSSFSRGFLLAAALILVLVTFVYWQVQQGSFVWDDKLVIHDNAWLLVGNGWQTLVLHGLDDWRYFRPLGLALFVAEMRWFGIVAGPMHLVSLVLHLIDTSMVGLLAWRLRPVQSTAAVSRRLACLAMLVYGLHPALVEPIAWISCQCDPFVTLFVLLGLLANVALSRTGARAALVTVCFFLAACVKESAIAFPILLVLLDWLRTEDASAAASVRERLRELMDRQRFVYLGVFAAGIVYLVFRHWARANVGAPYESDSLNLWARFQTVCFTYMTYWRVIVWPFAGLSPAHIISGSRFTGVDLESLATDFAAVAVGIGGLLLAWRRQALGVLIMGVTATLFPVLHVIPIAFEDSLYHERYAMTGIAWACVLLPRTLAKASLPKDYRQIALTSSIAVAACWLLLATVTIRTTVPLWSNDHRMWTWALRTNPDSIYLMTFVLNADIGDGNLTEADEIARTLLPKAKSCAMCMMELATLALAENDAARAAAELHAADAAMPASPTQNLVLNFVSLNAKLHVLEHDEAGAEEAYRDAIAMSPTQSSGYFSLALLLAGQGRADEARTLFARSISLSAPDEVDVERQKFAAATAMGTRRPLHH